MTRSAFIAMQDPYVGHHNGMDDDMVRVPAVGVLPLVSWLPHLTTQLSITVTKLTVLTDAR